MSINAVYEDSQGNVHEARMDGDPTTKFSIADDFSAMVNYAVGDFCYHLGTLYKCTTAHTAGAWNAAHFTATQVGDEICELKNTITKQTYSVSNQSQYISILRYIQGNIDFTKITDTSYIKVSYSGSDRIDIYKLTRNGEKVVFSFISGGNNALRVWEASIFNNSSNPTLYLYEFLAGGNSITDFTNSDCTGQTWTLYY